MNLYFGLKNFEIEIRIINGVGALKIVRKNIKNHRFKRT